MCYLNKLQNARCNDKDSSTTFLLRMQEVGSSNLLPLKGVALCLTYPLVEKKKIITTMRHELGLGRPVADLCDSNTEKYDTVAWLLFPNSLNDETLYSQLIFLVCSSTEFPFFRVSMHLSLMESTGGLRF